MVEQRVYTEKFKREADRLADERGNRAETARQLGISDSVLLRWKKRLTGAEAVEPGLPAFPGSGNARDAEVTRLKRENLCLHEEKGFFAHRTEQV